MVRIVALALVLASSLLVAPSVASACEMANPFAGVGPLSSPAYAPPPLPRNVAFVWQQIPSDAALPPEGVLVAETSDGAPVMAFPLKGPTPAGSSVIVKPVALLTANARLRAYSYGQPSLEFQTSDVVDQTPPGAPVIESAALVFHDGSEGCAQSSCGDYTNLTFSLTRRVSDDHAESDQIVYGLYVGPSASEVESAATPYALLYDFDLTAPDELTGGGFIAVSAFDQAGNESARSSAYRVEGDESEGCALGRRRPRLATWVFAAAALALGLRRASGARGLRQRGQS